MSRYDVDGWSSRARPTGQDVSVDPSEIAPRIAVMRTQIKMSGSDLTVYWQSSEQRPFKARWGRSRDVVYRNFSNVVKLLAFQANETSSSLVSSTTQHWYIDCAPAFQVGEESLILSCCSISFVPMMLSMAVRTKNFAFGDLFFDTVDMPAGMNHSRHTQLFG